MVKVDDVFESKWNLQWIYKVTFVDEKKVVFEAISKSLPPPKNRPVSLAL